MPAKIELDPADLTCLTFALGVAAGTALNQGNDELAYSFLGLANRIHRDNPDWKPYNIPDTKK